MRQYFAIFLSIFMLLSPLAGKSGSDKILLRMSVQTSISHPHSKAAEYFVRLVERRSGGRISVKLYTDGTLGDTESTLNQIGFGGIALALVNGGAFSGIDGILMAEGRDDVMNAAEECWDELSVCAEKQSAVMLAAYWPELIAFYSTRQINGILSQMTIGELDGIDLSGSVYSTVSLDKDNVYNALSTGSVDAAAENLVDFCQSERYLFSTDIILSEKKAKPVFLIASRDVFQSLGEEDQILISNCAYLSSLYANSLLLRAEENLIPSISREKSVRETYL